MGVNFWKNHDKLRMAVIFVFFMIGLVLTFVGWKMTGQLMGLGIMILGIIFLLTALLVYNKPFQDTKKK